MDVQKRVQRKCIFIDKEYWKECENWGKIGLFNTAIGKAPEALLGQDRICMSIDKISMAPRAVENFQDQTKTLMDG